MIEYLLLLVALLRATVRDRGGLIAENLLLRQQLAVLSLWGLQSLAVQRAPRAAIMAAMIECLFLLMALLRATVCDRGDLVAQNLLLRHQLAVLTRPTRKRPRLRARDKLLWLLARLVEPAWRQHLVVVRPETVIRWRRRGWRLFWWWRSRCPLGRPRLSMEVRALIASMSRARSGKAR